MLDQTPTPNDDPSADHAPLQQPNDQADMIRTLTFKEFHQRMLDECPRFSGDEQIRAETQQLIDAMPTEPLPLPKPADEEWLSLEEWLDQLVKGMGRMANDEVERMKVARRLF